jgi:hypothetical protein
MLFSVVRDHKDKWDTAEAIDLRNLVLKAILALNIIGVGAYNELGDFCTQQERDQKIAAKAMCLLFDDFVVDRSVDDFSMYARLNFGNKVNAAKRMMPHKSKGKRSGPYEGGKGKGKGKPKGKGKGKGKGKPKGKGKGDDNPNAGADPPAAV